MKYLNICFLAITFYNANGQQNQKIYLNFDTLSQEICIIPQNDIQNYHDKSEVKKYQKEIQKNGEVLFYICGELFILTKNTKIDTCSITELKNIYLSDIFKVKKNVDAINPLYPEKVFEKIFLIEKINEKSFVKYEVKWKYYIE
jgi:hypothetical protein